MNIIDSYCLTEFPELLEIFSREELEEASSLGSYIFHEDYLNRVIVMNRSSASFLKRVADYIEYLASSKNKEMNYLAQIGIVEALINEKIIEAAEFFGESTKLLLFECKKTTKFQMSDWLNNIH